MKTWTRIVMLFLLIGGTASAQQYQPEVPGDHFSLQGALELFKKSSSPEEFERLLNSADAGVNNLDLNGDGDIDYIRVIDRNEGNVHAFILQAVISERESQDVAVIELEKLANGKAVLQITGDADIYGIETIIEPTEEVRINAGTSTVQTVVNVWGWPSVQYVYGPFYSGWSSPWSWHHRPYWWNPWRPTTYIAYYPRWESYRPYYAVCHTHRIQYAQHLYRPYRNTSVVVYTRHHLQIANYRASRSSAGYTRGRDDSRDNTQRGDYNRSRSLTGERDNSRSLASDWKRNESRRKSDWNQAADNRRSAGTRDESAVRNRSNPNVTREASGSQRTFREQRDDSRNRSNHVNPNSERRHEFKGAPETRGPRITPQIERRESGNSGGQRSAPQFERKQSSENSGQRSGSMKSSANKRGRD